MVCAARSTDMLPSRLPGSMLWLLEQPIGFTGQILTITGLRQSGVVRPFTPHAS